MENVIFKAGQGEGVILDYNEKLTDCINIDKSDIILGDTVLIYEQQTTLCGWFDVPVKYCGKDKNKLYFYLGDSDSSLFEAPKKYYETMRWITPMRFFRMYSHSSGRDFNFVNGKWK